MNSQILAVIAPKLGIHSQSVLRKTEELSRLAKTQHSTSNSLTINETCRVVMFLDLASSACAQPIDKTLAIKMSGVSKKVYNMSYKTVESLLGLQKQVSVRDLCVQFGCTDAVDWAKQVLQSYGLELSDKGQEDIDLSRPLFQGAAVVASCRKLKIKIDRSKLIDHIGTKKSIMDKLITEMERHATLIETKNKDKQRKRGKNFIEDLENKIHEEEVASKVKKVETNDDEAGENATDFQAWKEKILGQSATG
ncbi:origin recognition complex subunit 6-like [Tubulanus polymorphus]|uniref:origin recognition complex subunit 6-like n=1 Tax=Tubulanus polymorphus TaxID=672921 RepID=UPI003DA5B970